MDDKGNPLLMLSSFAEAYHWTLSQVMELTWPQIVMLNHASAVNSERSDRRYKAKDKNKGNGTGKKHAVLDNKSWNEMSPEEQAKATDDMMMQL